MLRPLVSLMLFLLGLIVGLNMSHMRGSLVEEKVCPACPLPSPCRVCPRCPEMVKSEGPECKGDCSDCAPRDYNEIGKSSPGNYWVDLETAMNSAQRVFHYENPIMPPKNIIDARKQTYAILPKSAIDFAASDTRFLKLAEKLAPFVTECATHGGYKNNGMIFWDDFSIAYAMVRLIKPMRVIEVGSGYSTSAVFHARRMNNMPTSTQTCVDPYRSKVIDAEVASQLKVIPKFIQELELSVYKELQANDILYLDSSHVFQPFGDTILELNFILPELNPGVIVHIHDIFIPFNYPDMWIYGRPYTENWALALFLLNNSEWEVIFPNYYMLRVHKDRMKSLGFLSRGSEYTKEAGELDSAIWLRRKIPGETKSPFA